jgi:hypothetical protein
LKKRLNSNNCVRKKSGTENIGAAFVSNPVLQAAEAQPAKNTITALRILLWAK